MATPLVTYGDLVGIETFHFLLARGVEPSRGVLSTPVLGQAAPAPGDITVAYDGETLTLTDCAVVDAQVSADNRGQTMVYTFHDRRWRWQYSQIIGRYNVRLAHDELEHEKTPQELAVLCLEALGETVFDVSALPNLARPHVDWASMRADLALAALLRQFDCDIAPDLSTGGVRVVKIGSGAALPAGGWRETAAGSVTPPIQPERIQIVTAPVRFQCLFELQAVGKDVFGDIKPIDNLTYKPAGGWADEDPDMFAGVTGTYVEDGATRDTVELARETVFRWYRIKEIVGGGGVAKLNPPGFEETQVEDGGGPPEPEEISHVLPLLPRLNETYIDPIAGEKQKPLQLIGAWTDDGQGGVDDNVDGNSKWPHGFGVDLTEGIVKLPFWAQYVDEGSFEPARLLLKAVCEVEHLDYHQKIYYVDWRNRAGVDNPTLVFTQHQPDIVLRYTANYTDNSGVPELSADAYDSNSTEVFGEIEYYLDAIEEQLVPQSGEAASYADLLLISPDGAIEQVEWSTDGRGVTTRAGRFTRINRYLLSYRESGKQAAREAATERAEQEARRELEINFLPQRLA